eukprot:1180966-Rhodomonas_salina.2
MTIIVAPYLSQCEPMKEDTCSTISPVSTILCMTLCTAPACLLSESEGDWPGPARRWNAAARHRKYVSAAPIYSSTALTNSFHT